jgi:hypothetical protein
METPMLFPYEPEKFWQMMQQIVREEVSKATASNSEGHTEDVPG